MKKKIVFIIPSAALTGPSRGAYALANGLSKFYDVHFFVLKNIAKNEGIALLNPKVNYHSLGYISGFLNKRTEFIKVVSSFSKEKPFSISMCFSADIFNLSCAKYVDTCTSIRGNLYKNYSMDYGLPGFVLAFIHLFSTRWFKHVVSMTKSMAAQVDNYSAKPSLIIGNCIDESLVERYRVNKDDSGLVRFVFIGSVSKRKCPLLLIDSFKVLRDVKENIQLDMIGDGPLLDEAKTKVKALGLESKVTFHGQLSNPFPVLSRCHLIVAPSRSEGVSRAVLEALFLGLKAILRNIDGNGELLSNKSTYLFNSDEELFKTMLHAVNHVELARISKSNIPKRFQQDHVVSQFELLIEKASD